MKTKQQTKEEKRKQALEYYLSLSDDPKTTEADLTRALNKLHPDDRAFLAYVEELKK